MVPHISGSVHIMSNPRLAFNIDQVVAQGRRMYACLSV
jgi:hypothetical protein